MRSDVSLTGNWQSGEKVSIVFRMYEIQHHDKCFHWAGSEAFY